MVFDKDKCCGCSACFSVCPVQAIKWTKNKEGFSEPEIIEDKCIDCGLCRKVCPYEEDHVGKDADPEVYAAVHKDKKVLLKSSSGGAFTALSDAVFRQGGVVYGVEFDREYGLVYGRASDKDAAVFVDQNMYNVIRNCLPAGGKGSERRESGDVYRNSLLCKRSEEVSFC